MSKLYYSRKVFNQISSYSRLFTSINHFTPFSSNIHTDVTIKDAYTSLQKIFTERNIPDAEPSARYLLCEVSNIGYRQSDFKKNFNFILNKEQLNNLNNYTSQRLDRVPIQYIIGNWDFFGLMLFCEKPILIPRPETEELIENIINSRILNGIDHPKILDIGSGTGAIGLALLSHYKHATVTAIDLNPKAVQLANKNAKLQGTDFTSRYECRIF